MATKPVKISSFLGVNERLHRSALRVEEGVFVAQAHNVDLTPSGQFVGRAGYQRVVAGSDMHSLWATAAGRAFVAADKQMCALDVRSGALQPLGMTLPSTARLAFAELADGDIAVTDGRTLLRIQPDNRLSPMLAPAPAPQPVAQLTPGSRHFLYCFAYVDARGVVGLCTPVRHGVGEVLSFDVPAPPAGLTTQIYVSHPGGEVMYLLAESLGGTVTAGEQRMGGQCPTLHLQALPAGDALQLHGGRLYVVRGSAIYFSEPYQFGAMAPTNFLQLPAPVTVLAAMPSGLFVVADKTYWMQGTDPAAASMAVVNEHTGIARSLARLSDGRAVWGSSQGVVVGNGAGEVVSLSDAVVPAPRLLPGTKGATLPMERNGVDQIISKRSQPGYGRAGVTMEAE